MPDRSPFLLHPGNHGNHVTAKYDLDLTIGKVTIVGERINRSITAQRDKNHYVAYVTCSCHSFLNLDTYCLPYRLQRTFENARR